MARKKVTRRQKEIRSNNEQFRGGPSYLIPNAEQKRLVHSIRNNTMTLVSGSAGTGKTLFCLQTLYQMLELGDINQIIIVRLALQSPEEEIGSLPGTDLEKLYPYMMPIIDNLELFLPLEKIIYLIEKQKIKITPYSFVRGRSFHKKGIIVEEAQNFTPSQIMTIATRIGKGSKMLFNGDDIQSDMSGRHGIEFLRQLLWGIDDIGIVQFKQTQIERNPLIADLIKRKKELDTYIN